MRDAARPFQLKGTQQEIAERYCGIFKVQSEDVSQFVSDIDEWRISSRSYRLSFGLDADEGHSLIVVTLMPSPAHGTAIRALSYLLINAVEGDTTKTVPKRLIFQGGATTHKSSDGKVGKEPDDHFRHRLANRNVTTVVLEIGMSETPSHLKLHSRIWLEKFPEVQLVILVSVYAKRDDATDALPSITITQWVPVKHTPIYTPRPGTEARTHCPKQLGDTWQADACIAPGPFSIPAEKFFVKEAIPETMAHLESGVPLIISQRAMQDMCEMVGEEWLQWKNG